MPCSKRSTPWPILDELTDLPSRRSFNDAKLRLGNTYTVAMVDVDHFKHFNDTYGHDAGDQVLRMVAARIAEVSGGGKGYRYGGEDVAVLFPGNIADETFPSRTPSPQHRESAVPLTQPGAPQR